MSGIRYYEGTHKEFEDGQEWLQKTLNEATKQLTEWEQSFLESVQSQMMKSKWISSDQLKIVERLYADKT